MACRKASTYSGSTGSGPPGGGGYTSEADCLNACKDGACCTGTTCAILPACACQGAGKTFKGVGTTCTPNPCDACVNYCSPYPTHPVTLTMEISSYSGPTPAKFSVNTSRSIERATDGSGGTASCWAYSGGLFNIGDVCPNPAGSQVIDGILLSAIFSTNGARLFANYKDANGDCHRYDIRWSLTSNDSAQSRLCAGDFPFSGSVSDQGVSFNYLISANPLP